MRYIATFAALFHSAAQRWLHRLLPTTPHATLHTPQHTTLYPAAHLKTDLAAHVTDQMAAKLPGQRAALLAAKPQPTEPSILVFFLLPTCAHSY